MEGIIFVSVNLDYLIRMEENEMKTAIITGASSGIGLAISKALLEEGYTVYGFGRDFSKTELSSEKFHAIVCDLMNTVKLTEEINQIRKKEEISLLVNNAGVGYFGPHEEQSPKKIHEMVMTNLEIPMLLSQLLLRDLKKNGGMIINISSITAKKSANTHGCVYGATKTALSSFSTSLYEETRKYGVKVIAIHPDLTATNFYRNANFTTSDQEEAYISPNEVADCIKFILSARAGITITDITLQPQKNQIKKH